MSVYKIPLGNPMVLAHQLPDGHTGKYVRAVLRRPDGTALVASPINLAHVGNGLYTNDDENMPSQQFVTSTYITYSDAAYTIVDVAYGFGLEVFFLTGVTVDNIVDQVWDEKLSVHVIPLSTGAALSDIETDVGTLIGKSDPPTASETADAVWDETLADHVTSGSTGAKLDFLENGCPSYEEEEFKIAIPAEADIEGVRRLAEDVNIALEYIKKAIDTLAGC